MNRRIAAITVMILVATAVTWADTLVLTNGRRVQGELVGVSGRDIEFEERSGNNRRIVRIARRDVARIEFGDPQFDFDDSRNDRRDVPQDLSGGIPRGMRERQISVTAREQWIDTGINVRAGQQVFFQASGEVRWGPNRRDGAAGERNSPFNAGRPLPDRPAASLIGRIGEQDVFFIGADTMPVRVRANGRLYLGVNDDVLTDNSGALNVKVYY
jgi:hypothetical protein